MSIVQLTTEEAELLNNDNPTNQVTQLGTKLKQLAENLAQTEIVFHDDVPAYYPVVSTGYMASSSNPIHIGKVVGIITENARNGVSQVVVISGLIVNTAWSFTPGMPVYLNGNTLSNTAPDTGFVQRMGVATSSSAMIVAIGPSIRKT